MSYCITAPAAEILSDGIGGVGGENRGYALAFDIGTTTVAGYLLAPGGKELAHDSAMNPQIAFGADVISRIRHAMGGQMEALTDGIRRCADKIGRALCQNAVSFRSRSKRSVWWATPPCSSCFWESVLTIWCSCPLLRC